MVKVKSQRDKPSKYVCYCCNKSNIHTWHVKVKPKQVSNFKWQGNMSTTSLGQRLFVITTEFLNADNGYKASDNNEDVVVITNPRHFSWKKLDKLKCLLMKQGTVHSFKYFTH